MMLPDRIDADWIDSLSDEDLVSAERQLRTTFSSQEAHEKARRGESYDLLRGPETLTSAWMRWSMVNNATAARGLRTRYR